MTSSQQLRGEVRGEWSMPDLRIDFPGKADGIERNI